MAGTHLALENISHKYSGNGKFSLEIKRFDVEEGEKLVILGENGAGKSSLIRILSLIEKPLSGNIFYRGSIVNNGKEALSIRRRFSVVFQKPVLFRGTAEKNVELALKIKGYKWQSSTEKIEKVFNLLKINNLRHRDSSSLSGGESRKVSLAMALVSDPEVLFLDEPTAFLDDRSKASFEETLISTLKKLNMTLIYVTHSIREALSIGEKVYLMHKGQIIQYGPIDKVFNNPTTIEAANLTGSLVVSKGKVANLKAGVAEISLPEGITVLASAPEKLNIGDKVTLTIRPDSVVIHESKQPYTSTRNVFKATVKNLRNLDGIVEVNLNAKFPLKSFVTIDSSKSLRLSPGKKVFVSFKATSVNLIHSLGRNNQNVQ